MDVLRSVPRKQIGWDETVVNHDRVIREGIGSVGASPLGMLSLVGS
jgi:hypothetical protein